MAPTQDTNADDALSAQTVWAFGSFGIQALAGAVLTFWLAWYEGREALGIFNQLYAIFVILGQLFVCGLNDSSLKHAAQHRLSPADLVPVLKTSLICGLGTGLCGGLITLMLVAPVSYVTDSEDVGAGMLYLGPAIFLFVINKVLTGLVNGQQRIRYFAVSQSARAAALVVLIIAISVSDVPMSWFGLAFIGAEALVLALFVPVILEAVRARVPADLRRQWIRTHMKFGIRAVPHGLLAETFLRVDILVLAVFLSDAEVGLYSFVAFFVEGIYQIPYAVRIVTTPRLVPILARRSFAELRGLALRSSSTSFVVSAVISVCLIFFSPVLQEWFPLLKDGRVTELFYILLLGLCVYAISGPFESIFLAADRPALQSVFMVIVTGINVCLNFILIPVYGIIGAAIATAISFVAAAILLNAISFRTFRIHAWDRDG